MLDSQIDVENVGVRGMPARVPAVNPCAIQSVQPSIARSRASGGERMLNGKKYFDSFPDEQPASSERGADQKSPTCLTAELRAALEELDKYFQQFRTTVAE